MDPALVKLIARHELKINVRNKWTSIFAFVFSALALGIAYFGLATAGEIGFQGFTRTSASLLSLVLYLIPILALLMAALSFTGEKGASELLFSQPVTRGEIVLGKVLGLLGGIIIATLFGFGIAGAFIAAGAGIAGSARYLAFVGFALLLACAFLAIGVLVSALSRARSRAFGTVLSVWFFFVLFYDLLVIGGLFLFSEHVANLFIFLSLFGNPVDLARVGTLITLGDTSIFGVAGAALIKFLGGGGLAMALLVLFLLAWCLVPLLLATRAVRRLDL